MARKSKNKTQVKVCNVCGDRGFSNALLHCAECPDVVVHQYCLGIPPGSIDDSFIWVCECCYERKSDNASSNGSEENCEEHAEVLKKFKDNLAIIPLEDQPEPIFTVLPLQYEGSSDQALSIPGLQKTSLPNTSQLLDCMECPKEIARDLILLASMSGEIHMRLPDYMQSLDLATFVHHSPTSRFD